MNQKKVIVFMPVIDDGGGVEKNFFLITNYLSSKFKDISVISLSISQKKKLDPKIKFISFKKIFFKFYGRRIKFIISLILLFKELLFNRNATVLCFQGLTYCVIICKILSVKVIIRSNSSPSGWSHNYIKKKLYKIIYGMADIIIVNSKKFKQELKSRFNLESICIFNPLNKKEIIRNSKKKIQIKFFTDNSFKIISVARFADQKDHLCIIKSINLLKNKFKNIKVLLIGSGEKKREIKNMIHLFRLKKIIKIMSFKKNPYPFMKKANIFILSSKFEGLPNVLLEAITLNKFVISSNCPTGPSEILDNGKGGLLFKVGDHIQLSKKITFALNNKKECNNKLLFAKKRLQRFDYHNNLLKYFKILKNS
ncbi:glycosyltransferase [Candidatus Pelagibacter sp.]|nr:glycosyltransferase [Candidatus Pelagibacter sp.]